MKKGCLIVAILVPVILLAAGSFAYYRANQQLGLSEAPAVSHETLATPQTRIRAVLNPDKLTDLVLKYLPQDQVQIPSWSPYKLNEILPMVFPREIALLAGADYGDSAVHLTVFANERRGGPMVVQELRKQNPFRQIPYIKWNSEPLQFPKRGVITVDGKLPIPEGVEEKVLESWSHDAPADTPTVSGDHLLEGVLDNRNGEIVTLAATFMQLAGNNWQDGFNQPEVQMAYNVIKILSVIRVAADLDGYDKANLHISLGAIKSPASQSQLQLVIGFAYPEIKAMLQEYNLTLEGEFKWNAQENALVGDLVLSGLEPLLDQYMSVFVPVGSVSAS